jgi:ABC-type nitrate/sulfonate/bicarbonate transport system substrate-binding protein
MSKARLLFPLALAVFVSAPAANAADSEIKIGWQPASFFEFFSAREHQMFEKAGLKPTYIKFLSGPAMFAALKSGDVDVTFGGMPPFVHGIAQDLDLSIFLWTFTTTPPLVVRPDSGIRSIKDLANKKIGTVMGSSAHYTLAQYLTDNGMPMSSVQVLNMPVTSLVPAFTKSDIPAAIIWEPWGVKLMNLGGTRVGNRGGFDKYSQTGIYWGRRVWMEQHSQVMQQLLGVLDNAMAMVRKDPAAAANALAKQTGLDPEEALQIIKNEYQTNIKSLREPFEGHPLSLTPAPGKKYSGHVEALVSMADFLYQNGNIKVKLTPEQLTKAQSAQFLATYLKK